MERWVGRVALVTGASSGIGAAITESLVRHGMKVVACARNSDRIADMSSKLSGEKGQLFPIRCDVTKEDEIKAMFKQIRKDHGGLDVCINNAGVAHDAPLLSGKTEHWRNMLEVNVLGLAVCTREAYVLMKEKKIDDGHIIHIGSGSGHRIPNSAEIHFYAATKAAVQAHLEGLRNEIKATKSHIRVSAVSPGMVATEIRVRMQGEEAAKQLYSRFETLKAKDIADVVINVLGAPQHVEMYDIIVVPTEQM